MKNRIVGFISMLILIVTYCVLRYPLINLHMMKSWTFYLFVIGVIIISTFGIIKDNKIVPIFTISGYILGFVLGYTFQFDYGKELNSMWIIWTCFYIANIVIGIFITFIIKKYKNKKGA